MAIPQTVIVKRTCLTNEAGAKVGAGFLPDHGLTVERAINLVIHERVPVKMKTLKHQQDVETTGKDEDIGSPGGWCELNCHT